MSAFLKVDMAEATRQTRAGKLAEAMALLQGRAIATSGETSPTTGESEPDRGAGRVPPTLDMAAPSVPGGAWTAAEDPSSAEAFTAAKAAPFAGPTPERLAVRDWLARLTPKAWSGFRPNALLSICTSWGSGKTLVSAAWDREDRLSRGKEAVMEWVLKLEAKSGWGEVETIEVGRLERRVSGLTAEELGVTLHEILRPGRFFAESGKNSGVTGNRKP